MPPQDSRLQQRVKIRRTTLGFGILQILLGLVLTTLSFTAFALTASDRIRNACPYWAGFTVLFSGGVGVIAWRHPGVLSMGLFSFFSAVCVVLQMIGTILTGDIGGFLKSIVSCQSGTSLNSCFCCDSVMSCQQDIYPNQFDGIIDCEIIQGQLKELMYGLCVLNIFGCLICFIATVLGCTSVARHPSREELLSALRHSTRTESTCTTEGQYEWSPYPNDPHMLPSYAPPAYRSFETFQDFSATSTFVVPPPVYDPTDFPPPYSSRDISVASSQISISENNANTDGTSGTSRWTSGQPSCSAARTQVTLVQQNYPIMQLCSRCGKNYRHLHQCGSDGTWAVQLPPYQQSEGNNNVNGSNVTCSQSSGTTTLLLRDNIATASAHTQISCSEVTPDDSAQEISSSEFSSSYESTVSSLNTPPQANFLTNIAESTVRGLPTAQTIDTCTVSNMNYSNTVINGRSLTVLESSNKSTQQRGHRSQRSQSRSCRHHRLSVENCGASIIPPNVELPLDFFECDFAPNTSQNRQSQNRRSTERNKARASAGVEMFSHKKRVKSKRTRDQQQRPKRPRCAMSVEPKAEAVSLLRNGSAGAEGINEATDEATPQHCRMNSLFSLNKETVV